MSYANLQYAAKAVPLHRCSFAEYLAIEEVTCAKHECQQGEIHARAGGTREHAAPAAAVTTTGQQLRILA